MNTNYDDDDNDDDIDNYYYPPNWQYSYHLFLWKKDSWISKLTHFIASFIQRKNNI